MSYILTKIGEEFSLKNNLEGAAVSILLYDDSVDGITDLLDLADVTTEPTDGNYARLTGTLTLADVSDDWAARTSSELSFDVTDTTGNVQSYGIVANFQSTTAGDGSAVDHLIATGALSQTYDLSMLNTLGLSAGSVGFKIQ